MQTEVAQLAAPDRVVAQGIALGLTAPAQVVNLPEVPLDTPLPVPNTTPVGGTAPGAPSRPPPRPRRPPALGRHRPSHDDARPVSPAVLLGRRTRAMRLLLVAVFAVMVLRLVQVQEFGNQHYAALSRAQLTQSVTVPPVRGGIYDRNGEVLAETVTRQTVVADPLIIAKPAAVAAALSPLLGIPADSLRAKLTGPSGFVYLAHRVPDAVAAAVAKLNLNGINLVPESQRVVPVGRLAQPVVGTVGWDGNGTSGMEYQYSRCSPASRGRPTSCAPRTGSPSRREPVHPGHAGHGHRAHPRRVAPVRGRAGAGRRDRGLARHRRHRRGDGRQDRRHPGHGQPDVHDDSRRVREHHPHGVRPATLAAKVASTPDTSGPTLVAQSDTLPAGVAEAPSNLALTQVYEPGSVFKLVTFSAALADGVITPSTRLRSRTRCPSTGARSTTPSSTPPSS